MAAGVDLGLVIKSTLAQVADRLGIPRFPLVMLTDSRSLYDCLVRLGTTKEKRLMIDIMGFREAYEKRQIDEVRWIKGTANPADSMTKATPSKALESLVSTNGLELEIQGWVERPPEE